MEKRENAKIASIVIALAVVATCMFDSRLGIYRGCEFYNRCLYPFFHVNMLHAILNVWCLLSIVFMYNIGILRLSLSYFATISIPSFLLNDRITLGMSGAVFFLFASISFEVQRKMYYQSWMFFYLVIGFFLPNTNGNIHLYCYLLGLFYAILNKPIYR